MNLYKYFTHPEQLDGYENRIRIPDIAYRAAENGEITWEQAEPYIMKDPRSACWNALVVLKHRWPEAEQYIVKDPWWTYWYAYNILKHRWPEAEPYIMKDPRSAYLYVFRVIKRRWPKAEPHIMKDLKRWNKYKRAFGL